MTLESRESVTTGRRTPAKAAIAAVIGHVVEYYDFAIYALLAPILAPVFFPTENPTASLLATFAVFGVAYVIRPLGGLIFGHLADKVGRRRTLSTVILLMAGATTAIGLLPGYGTIGLTAPVLLVVCRVLQGLSTGGEYSGSASFVTEHAPPTRRGFFTSWLLSSTGLGLAIGAVVGTVLTSVVSQAAMENWGWRIPFLIALPLGAVGLYLRLTLDDAPEFKEAVQDRKNDPARRPLVEAIRLYPRPILTLAGLVILLTTSVYVFFVFMSTYLYTFLDIPLATALPASIAGFLVLFFVAPVFGALSDRVGRKPVLIAGTLAHVALVVPIFTLIQLGTTWAIVVGYLSLAVTYACYAGPFTAAVAEQFPASVRAASLGIGYQLPVCVFGGLSPLILTYLIDMTGNNLVPAFYATVAAGISMLAVLTLRPTSPVEHSGRQSEDEETVPVH
jgi:MFS transporter, MHS family, proline/betaine transporter